MLSRVVVSIAILLACAPAYAQHDHGEHVHGAAAGSHPFAASLSLVGASFDTTYYTGNYEGAVPSFGWDHGRFGVIASEGFYRVEKNGGIFYGPGDAMVHGQARLLRHGGVDAGCILGVSAPTGNEQHGMGMGHVMLMPALFGTWSLDRVRVAASAGYDRAIGAGDHADHGMGPLVSPMLASEISWSAGADVLLAPSFSAGARTAGGIPTGTGDTRAIVAARAAWSAHSMQTAFELQAGVAGDPFTLRGVVSTALSF